jgi:chemotaxis methyl-accepting protein methylase
MNQGSDGLEQLARRLSRSISLAFGIQMEGREGDLTKALEDWCREKGILPGQLERLGMDRLVAIGGELMRVGETFFMRQRASTEDFLVALSNRRNLKIWCPACSSGEEPYSMAILLMNMGKEDFHIIGTDISPSAIAKAMRGVYSRWSLRGMDGTSPVRTYFDETPDGLFQLKERYRRNVTFHVGNVFQPPEGAFHGVSCRNLFIYFTEEAIRRALEVFHRILLEGGLLTVGYAEAPSVASLGRDLFAPAGHSTFQAVLHGHPQAPGGHNPKDRTGPTPARPPAPSPRASAPKGKPPVEGPQGAQGTPSPHRTVEEITRMADGGDLEGALAACRAAQETHVKDPRFPFLEGVVLMDMGLDQEAMRALSRAVFIDPLFPEAHYCIMMLAASRGDLSLANRHARLLLSSIQGMDDDGHTLLGESVRVRDMRRAAQGVIT